MVFGRIKELTILKNAESDSVSRFIAVYGRRRVGKTFLIREGFGYRFTFQHAGLSKGGLKKQLSSFEASLKDAGMTSVPKCKNWMEAFELLKDLIRASSEKRKIIFLDELSWMDTQNSDLIPALENFWNGWASARKDIVLIVCASATSWIMNKIIHNRGGLHNRITDRILLENFTLSECEMFTRNNGLSFSREQILQYYMVFGGVPYYWTFLKKGMSIAQNIDSILFAKDAALKDEFDYLYSSIFAKPEEYLTIIKTLSTRKAGMTREELIKNSGIPNSGNLTKKLNELESCGFIRKYSSFGKKAKNSLFQLIDNFTLFYYRFLETKTTDEHLWTNIINTPRVNTWAGLAYERVVLQHTNEIKRKLGISGIHTEIQSWYAIPDKDLNLPGVQIDLLIVRNDRVINLCEIKYSLSEFTITKKDDADIKTKVDVFMRTTKTRHAIFPTLITTVGLVDNTYSTNIQSVITLEDLFG
ncbi:MAG: ATP-binding protein [Lachnospiraceae bacterium]|nr:ATP-binding protein [Lachnospiraceae bacterium]